MDPGADPSVLQLYRHLLRTASTDWQETAHRHALLALGPDVRQRFSRRSSGCSSRAPGCGPMTCTPWPG